MQKPSIPKGTRDFTPLEMVKRNFIFDTIKKVFTLYGYSPIETPAMENLSTLLGKYGEEGDKLLFKILNSGDFLKKTKSSDFESPELNSIASKLCEKGLRYDLTVPFARFVVQHQNELQFPFKRFQIQPVWRADRPQKGRYREFFQCDVDVIGSNSLLNELELLTIIEEVFSQLNISVTVKLNNRKILAGIAEYIEEPDRIIDITVAIDKIEKIGVDKVNDELAQKGIPAQALSKLQPILSLQGSNEEKLAKLSSILSGSELGIKGIQEIEQILSYTKQYKNKVAIDLDLTLARGLNYYTGAIFEVKANDVLIGSVCGGGRYDDLTGIFGLKDVSGVGISFGADRIYDVLNQLDLYPTSISSNSDVLVVNFGETESLYALGVLKKLRQAGISSQLYPEAAKLKKQMNYADKNAIPWVILIGEQEMETNELSLKHMESGEQFKLTVKGIIEKVGPNDQ